MKNRASHASKWKMRVYFVSIMLTFSSHAHQGLPLGAPPGVPVSVTVPSSKTITATTIAMYISSDCSGSASLASYSGSSFTFPVSGTYYLSSTNGQNGGTGTDTWSGKLCRVYGTGTHSISFNGTTPGSTQSGCASIACSSDIVTAVNSSTLTLSFS